MKFHLQKVFDISDVDQELRTQLFEYFEKSNDCYVSWEVGDVDFMLTADKNESWYDEDTHEMAKKFDALLIEAGAVDQEEIILRYGW